MAVQHWHMIYTMDMAQKRLHSCLHNATAQRVGTEGSTLSNEKQVSICTHTDVKHLQELGIVLLNHLKLKIEHSHTTHFMQMFAFNQHDPELYMDECHSHELFLL